MRSKTLRYTSLVIFVLILIQHQNCNKSGNVSFLNSDKDALNLQQGGADSFDGKPSPGDYIRTFPDFNCLNGSVPVVPGVQAILSVNTLQGTILRDNCRNTNFPVLFSDPEIRYSFFNSDFLAYGGAIFERVEDTAAPKHIAESFCQFEDSSIGMDVVVKSSLDGSSRVAKLYLGKKGATQIKYETADFIVSQDIQSQTTHIQASSYDFSLELENQSADGRVYVGKLNTTIDGQNYSLTTQCRRMTEDPVLFIDPTGLLAYFKFDVTSLMQGSRIPEASGQARIYTFNSLVSQVNLASGIIGGALPLNAATGPNGFNLVPSSQLPVSSVVTLSFWHNIPATLTYPSVVVSGLDSTVGNLLFASGVDSGKYYGNYFDPSLGVFGLSGITSQNTSSLNIWHHYVLVIDDTRVTAYVDGDSAITSARASPSVDILSRINQIWLGESGVTGAPTRSNDNGLLDELSLWTRALTATEVKVLFNKVVAR